MSWKFFSRKPPNQKPVTSNEVTYPRIVREDADVEKTAEGLFKGAYLGLHRGVASVTPGTPKFGTRKCIRMKMVGGFSIGWFLNQIFFWLEKDGWVEITMSIHLNLGLFWGSKMIIESESRNASIIIILKIFTHFDISGIFNVSACFFAGTWWPSIQEWYTPDTYVDVVCRTNCRFIIYIHTQKIQRSNFVPW